LIGKGRFHGLTTRLSGADIPISGAYRFSERLRRKTGCRLAWHRIRRVFVVYRERSGRRGPIRSYADIGPLEWPFTGELFRSICRVVRWGDASMSNDYDRMLKEGRRINSEIQDRETDRFIDERFPDFKADLNRTLEILSDNRRSQRIFDMTA